MTVKLYFNNTYLINSVTKITAVGQDDTGVWARLSETIFHPQGGGQKCDLGKINDIKVINTQHAEVGEINHYVDSNLTELNKLYGQTVVTQIDQNNRALNASLHTVGHLIANIVESQYPVKAVKGHHYPDEAKVEFTVLGDKQNICKETIAIFLQQELEKFIKNSVNISTIYDAQNNRTIKIANFIAVPCGGTHLGNTNQILTASIRGVKLKKDSFIIGYTANPNYGNITFVHMQ